MYLKNEKQNTKNQIEIDKKLKKPKKKKYYVYFFNSQLLTQILFKFSMYMRHTTNGTYQQQEQQKTKATKE